MTAHVTAVTPVAIARSSNVRWKIFLLMLFLISINYIDRASLSVAMPLIAKEFNLDPAAQGLLLCAGRSKIRPPGRWKFRPLRRPLAAALVNRTSRDEKALRPI